MSLKSRIKEATFVSNRRERFEELVTEMMQNGHFSRKQACWIINFLDSYLPII